PLQPTHAGRSTARLRGARVRRRGPLRRGALRQAVGDLALPAVGLRRTAPPGLEVPLPEALCVAPGKTEGAQTGDHPVRRLEHRPPRDRPEELALQPEELRLPAAGAGVADAHLRRARLR